LATFPATAPTQHKREFSAVSSAADDEGVATIRDVLTHRDRAVVMTTEDQSLRECAALLRDAKVGAILLHAAEDKHKVAGILSDKDFTKAVHADKFGAAAPASTVMTPFANMITVTPDTTLQVALDLMK
jgi:CBS domain-containing protein